MPSDVRKEGYFFPSFEDAPLIKPGGSHRAMLSHVCLGAKTGCDRLTVDVHRYQTSGHSVTNVHDNCEQAYYILAGKGEATVGGETREVREGSIIFIPRNAPHSIRNTGESELVLVFISTAL